MEVVYLSNDNVIELNGLKNASTDAFLNSATVTFTLKDSAGTAVTDADTITMSYVASSDGIYRGTLIDTVSLSKNTLYTCEITANAGAGLQGFWIVPVRALDRHAT